MKKREREIEADKAKDLQAFFDELVSESDRGAVLLAAALLDNLLAELLEAFMIGDVSAKKGAPTEVDKLLYEPYAPLGTFSSRARAAYCLGLLSVDAFRDIDLIRDIRNRFAHRLHGISFDSEAIALLCSKLSVLHAQGPPPFDTPRARFIFAATLYASKISVVSLEVRDRRKRTVPAPDVVRALSL